jgi:DNA-binding FadR family transcriptional regulator
MPAKSTMTKVTHIGATYRGPSLHGQVVHELGARIAGGSYAPGTVLPSEEDLCVQLHVSRTALREAIKVLAAKGLLAWRCRTLPDARFIEQLAEMREIIEPAAAQLAARHRSDEQMAEIQDALARMGTARSIERWVEADVDFHRAVLSATGNALLMPLAALIGSTLESLLVLTARHAQDFRVALPDHARVSEAIRTRDTLAAGQAMALLLADSRRRLLPPPATEPPARASRRHRG